MLRHLSCILVLAFPARAAVQDPGREAVLSAAREIIAGARYAALITRAADGTLQARTVDPFAPERDFTIWFATNPRTRKVAEIQADPRVTLYWFDPAVEGYVTLQGVARLVDDAEERRRRWKPEWEPFYPDRERGYLLVAVTPQRVEVVSPRHGITGDALTWRPPAVEFPPAGRPPPPRTAGRPRHSGPSRPRGDLDRAAVRVGRQTKGRRGTGVTVVTGLPLPDADLARLATELKRKCGSGGTVRDGVIELQGDHRDLVVAELVRLGWAAKRSGG